MAYRTMRDAVNDDYLDYFSVAGLPVDADSDTLEDDDLDDDDLDDDDLEDDNEEPSLRWL